MNINIDRRIPAFTGGFSPQQQQQRGGFGRGGEQSQAPRAAQTALMGPYDCIGCANVNPQLSDIAPMPALPTWAKILGGLAVILVIVTIMNVSAKKR